MKFAKMLLYIFPFIITAIIFTFLQSPTIKQNKKEEEKSLVEVSNTVFESWYDSKKKCMENKFFEDFKLKKNSDQFKFTDLDDTKKSLFKILYISKIKKECGNFNFITLNEKQKDKLKELQNFCERQLEENKQKIYNLNSSNLHPFDKDFLEKLDVYIFN